VRNFQARNYLRDQVKVGDKVLFYHSNIPQPAIVGTATVVRAGYPDFTAWDPRNIHYDAKSTPEAPIWYMVDIKAEERFRYPVTLDFIKQVLRLKEMVLLHRGRLSVQPVTPQEWAIIWQLGNTGKLSR
jgi:predicted RNA-binding protein with PUA-like domain